MARAACCGSARAVLHRDVSPALLPSAPGRKSTPTPSTPLDRPGAARLAGRQVRKSSGVGDGEQLVAFKHAEPVRRFLYARGPLIAALHVALPPLRRTFAERDYRAGAVLACTGLDHFGDRCHHCYLLWQRGHLPSSSQSARNFFCRLSNAAASAFASALSLRSTSRCSLSLSSLRERSAFESAGANFLSAQKAARHSFKR